MLIYIKKTFIIIILFLLLPTISFAQDVLTIYTYSSFASKWGPGLDIKKAFEKECNCQINFVSLEAGNAILNRIRLEGSKTKADIILGLDANQIKEAEQLGIIAKHKMNLEKLKLPISWNDEYFLPFDYGYYAFIYNSNKIKNPPKSMKEFLQLNYKVIYQDPRTSSVGFGLLLWLEKIYNKNSNKAWEKLAKNTITVTKGWSEAYNMFLKEESDFVLSYTTSPAYHMMIENKDFYKAAIFTEGHYMQMEVVAKTINANEKLANKFLAFVLSEEFQNHIPTKNFMYPVIDIQLPKEFLKLQVPKKALSFDADTIFKNKKAWIKSWQNSSIK